MVIRKLKVNGTDKNSSIDFTYDIYIKPKTITTYNGANSELTDSDNNNSWNLIAEDQTANGRLFSAEFVPGNGEIFDNLSITATKDSHNFLWNNSYGYISNTADYNPQTIYNVIILKHDYGKTIPEANQSKIENDANGNISVYLWMYVDYLNNDNWERVATVINDTNTSNLRDVDVGDTTGLDIVWNTSGSGWNSTGQVPGTYRVVVDVVNASGDLLQYENGTNMTDNYNFTLTDCDTTTPSCGDGTCNLTETCSSCPADCGCPIGYYCIAGVCVYQRRTPPAPPDPGQRITEEPPPPARPPAPIRPPQISFLNSTGRMNPYIDRWFIKTGYGLPLESKIRPLNNITVPCKEIVNYKDKDVYLEAIKLENQEISNEAILEPFKLRCDGEDLNFTINLPENYVNVSLLECVDNSCNAINLKKTNNLQCLGLPLRDIQRVHEYLKINYLNYKLVEKEILLNKNINILESGNKSITFYGSFDNSKAKIVRVDEVIKEPSNPFLKIIGKPVVVELSNNINSSIDIKLPYNDEIYMDTNSYAVYGKIGDNWSYIGGDRVNNNIQVHVKDINKYLDSDNKAIFAVIGIVDEFAYNGTSLHKVYDGTTRDAIILVHGLASSPATFNEIIDDIKLTEQPYQTWVLGYSTDKDIEDISKEFADLIELNSDEFDKVYIAAHSLGGLISQKALYHGYNYNYTFIDKVEKTILVGVPNEGSIFASAYENVFRKLINTVGFAKEVFNINSELFDTLEKGSITPRVPGIAYYVIAGTNPYQFGILSKLGDFNEVHDSLVTLKSAQRVGDDYINDRCSNFWDLYVTHKDLIDDNYSRKLLERIVAEEILVETGFDNIIGNTNYYEISINDCNPNIKYVVVGNEISKEEVFDPQLCLCGNKVCGDGENELNCPVDCAEFLSDKKMIGIYIVLLMILLFILYIAIKHIKNIYYKEWPELFKFLFLFKRRKNSIKARIQRLTKLINKYEKAGKKIHPSYQVKLFLIYSDIYSDLAVSSLKPREKLLLSNQLKELYKKLKEND